MLHRHDPIVMPPHAWLAVAMLLVCAASAQAQITLVYDTFTGANGTSLTTHAPDTNLPLSAWTIRTSGTIVLNGNAALSTQGDGYSWPSWAAIESNTCDGTIAVDWTPGAGLPYGPRAGLIVRMSDSLNYWFVGYGVQGTALALWKVANGSAGLVTSASVPNPLGATHHLEVRLEDSSIQVWYDGAQKIQWTDAFSAWSTMHGLQWEVNADWASTFDNFTVQTPSYQTVSSVVVSPSGSLTGVGAAQFLTATALNAQGQAIPDALFHWTLSDPTRGTLSTSGHYAAAAAVLALNGDLTVTAEMLGGPTGSAAITVDPARTMISDAFAGANGTNLTAHAPTLNTAQGTWSVHATQAMTLQDGQARSAQTDCPYAAVGYVNASTSDGVISADWTPGTTAPAGGLIFRVLNDYNYWFAGYGHQSTKLALFKYVSGSAVLVSYIDPGSVQGRSHHIEVRLSGASIEVWWDGLLRLQTSDSYAQTATRHGLMWGGCTDSSSTFDNFAVQLPPVAPSHHVTIKPATATLPPGGLQTFSAQAFDASNAVIPGTLFHWTISSGANGQIRGTSFFATSATLYGVTGSETVTATPVAGTAGTASVSIDASSTLIFDTFTGANGVALQAHAPDTNVVGSSWTTHTTGDIGLYNNHVHSTQQDAPYQPVALLDASTSDGVIAADWTPASGLPYGPVGGLMFRARDGYNAWFAGFGLYQSGLTLCKFVSGSTCQFVATTSIDNPLGATHRVEVRLAGPSIEVWWDGVLKLQASDSYNQSATKHGLMWGAATDWLSTFDHFSVRGLQYPTVSSVVVTPSNPSVALGGLQILTAQAFDAQNQVIANALFHWTINDPTGAVLATPNYFSSSAIVRAVAHNVTVTATMAWGPNASTTVTADASHTLVYDTFTGPQNTLLSVHLPDISNAGAAWQIPSGQPTPVLRSGELVPAAWNGTWQMQAAIETATTDLRIGADWTASADVQYPMGGIVFRQRDATNYWFAGYGWMTYPLALWQVVGGNWVPVSWSDVGPPSGGTHHLEVVTSGLSIEVWWDGVRRIQYRSSFAADGTSVGFKWYPAFDWTSTFDTFAVTGTPRCTSSLSPTSISAPFSGDAGTLSVTATSQCSWFAETDVPWIAVSSSGSGTGNGTIAYTIAENPTHEWRVGSITLGGRRVEVVQQPTPSPCTFGVLPGSSRWAGDGGSAAFDVTTTGGCFWTASTGAPWVHVSNAAGSGSDVVTFTLSPNPTTSPRSATIAVGGWPSTVYYTVEQDVAGTTGGLIGGASGGCIFRVSPFYVLFASGGGSQAITVSAASGCAAGLSALPAWLSVSPTQGDGTWTTLVTVGANSGTTSRFTEIDIGGAKLTIEQTAAAVDAGFAPLLGNPGGDYSHGIFVWTTEPGSERVVGYARGCDLCPPPPVLLPPSGAGGTPGSPDCESIPGQRTVYTKGCSSREPYHPEEGEAEKPDPNECHIDPRSPLAAYANSQPDAVYYPISTDNVALAPRLFDATNDWNSWSATSKVAFDLGKSPGFKLLPITDAARRDLQRAGKGDEKCAATNVTEGVIYFFPELASLAGQYKDEVAALLKHEMGHLLALNEAGFSNNPPTIMSNARPLATCEEELRDSLLQYNVTIRDAAFAKTCTVLQRNRPLP